MAIEITDANFEQLVNGDKLVIVDFGAEWCGPCKMISPIIEELAQEYEGKAIIGKVNVDENDGITSQFGIRNIPTILYFKNGEVVEKFVGGVPKSTLEDKLKELL